MEVKSFVMERGRSKVHDSGRIYGLVMHNWWKISFTLQHS
jgi:hypothetical protein